MDLVYSTLHDPATSCAIILSICLDSPSRPVHALQLHNLHLRCARQLLAITDFERQTKLTRIVCLQVGALVWNPHEKELLGGLGYPEFQVALWRFPTCQLMGEFHGHEQRILQLAISPDQCTVCTCASLPSLCVLFPCRPCWYVASCSISCPSNWDL